MLKYLFQIYFKNPMFYESQQKKSREILWLSLCNPLYIGAEGDSLCVLDFGIYTLDSNYSNFLSLYPFIFSKTDEK